MHLKLIEKSAEAEPFKTIDNSIAERKDDDRFYNMKDIERDLYTIPEEQRHLSDEELQELLSNGGIMKVYPFREDSKVEIPPPVMSFKQAFGNNAAIMAEIHKNGFEKPSPIQSQMWSTLLSGKDCIGVSQTGSGKTLAFLLPAFLHIDAQLAQYAKNEKTPSPHVLVLSPTRELAQQIEGEVQKYSYNGYRSVCLYGGGSRSEQVTACKNGVEIVIATPGRLTDLSNEGIISLASVTYVVLDEADRMLDMGFEAAIRRVLFEIRPDRLVALTSATWPEAVRSLTDRYTKEAIMAVNGSLDLTSCKSVAQYFEFIPQDARFERVCEIVNYLNNMHQKNYKMIIFVKSKVMADHLSSDFCMRGINSQGLHGGRSQQDREMSLKALRSGGVQILVATDLASRGIDVPDITHVINYDFPMDIEEYVHRVGRTGRAGRTGEAMSFLWWNDRSNFEGLISILEKSGQNVPEQLRRDCARYQQKCQEGRDGPRPSFRHRNKDSNFQSSY
uniref:RNA helicase n=1 Tax=Caenorhabditis japonica TaxID=281687 RepID=A0A8R1DHQ3_CAEJA